MCEHRQPHSFLSLWIPPDVYVPALVQSAKSLSRLLKTVVLGIWNTCANCYTAAKQRADFPRDFPFYALVQNELAVLRQLEAFVSVWYNLEIHCESVEWSCNSLKLRKFRESLFHDGKNFHPWKVLSIVSFCYVNSLFHLLEIFCSCTWGSLYQCRIIRKSWMFRMVLTGNRTTEIKKIKRRKLRNRISTRWLKLPRFLCLH